MKRGKRYCSAVQHIDRNTVYSYPEGMKKLKDAATAKFDETVEVAIKVKIKKGANVRNTMVIPHQFGDSKRILVFARGEKEAEAQAAGATYVGNDDIIGKIKDGWLDFDVAVATPDMMREIGKLGPILGRRGLMPNPKTKTVTMDVAAAIAELQKGRIEFRSDKTGVIHLPVGKVSMENEKIIENITSFIEEVRACRPEDSKGEFIKSIFISSTMGPGIRVASEG